jgi:hypothetical protein
MVMNKDDVVVFADLLDCGITFALAATGDETYTPFSETTANAMYIY